MRKSFWIAAFLIIITGFFIFAIFCNQNHQVQVSVPMPMNRVLNYLIDARKLSGWYFPFAATDSSKLVFTTSPGQKINSGDYYIEVIESNSINTVIKAGIREKEEKFTIRLFPDKKNINHSNVSLVYTTTLINRLFGNNQLEENAKKSIENLAMHLQSTKAMYGYDIQRIQISDPYFLFGVDTVNVPDKQNGSRKLFEALLGFAKEKKAVYNGVRIFHSVNLPDQRVALFAGIGINELVETRAGENFQIKMMPRGRDLVVANYEGPYGNINKVYAALEQYLEENKHTVVALPFEKYLSPGYGFADSQFVKLIVCFAVY